MGLVDLFQQGVKGDLVGEAVRHLHEGQVFPPEEIGAGPHLVMEALDALLQGVEKGGEAPQVLQLELQAIAQVADLEQGLAHPLHVFIGRLGPSQGHGLVSSRANRG